MAGGIIGLTAQCCARQSNGAQCALGMDIVRLIAVALNQTPQGSISSLSVALLDTYSTRVLCEAVLTCGADLAPVCISLPGSLAS